MLSKGSEALENNSVGLKVQGCVEGVGQGKSSLTPSLLFIVFLWYERLDLLMQVSVLA
jgi:hypothetical protein